MAMLILGDSAGLGLASPCMGPRLVGHLGHGWSRMALAGMARPLPCVSEPPAASRGDAG